MKRSLIFSKRTIKEILRDPLSYIFCLGFPIVMLVIMTIVNDGIPEQAHMTLFNIENLAPGIAVFGLTFVMLFAGLQLSKDRSTAFLLRLYASPMKPMEYITGYTLPMLIIAMVQCGITFVASFIIGKIVGYDFNLLHMLLCLVILIPSALMFVGFGMLFGSLLNDKSAPGVCSIIITASCILGGIWMDVDALGSGLKSVCHALPFYYGVNSARLAMNGEFDGLGKSLLILIIYGTVIYILAALALRSKMKKDIK